MIYLPSKRYKRKQWVLIVDTFFIFLLPSCQMMQRVKCSRTLLQNCFYFFLNNFHFFFLRFLYLVPLSVLLQTVHSVPFMLNIYGGRLRNKINYKLFKYLSQQRVNIHGGLATNPSFRHIRVSSLFSESFHSGIILWCAKLPKVISSERFSSSSTFSTSLYPS